MKIAYIEKTFSQGSLDLIQIANRIITEYQAQGFDLTLRQLYYQMVARDILANKQKEYKRLGSILNDARLAGLVDWDAMVDRTRNLRSNSHWGSPASILRSAAGGYLENRWDRQTYRPEVWIEKDALVGVIDGICRELDVPFFSCRGYTSQSEMWSAGYYRLAEHKRNGQIPFIIHLGDHDPSGMDMTRDIRERLAMFAGWEDQEIERIALNMNQIELYQPPPNPAKLTDSRASAYVAEFGDDSWELDALEPQVISDLIEDTVRALIDEDEWVETEERIQEHRKTLTEIASKYRAIQKYLQNGGEDQE